MQGERNEGDLIILQWGTEGARRGLGTSRMGLAAVDTRHQAGKQWWRDLRARRYRHRLNRTRTHAEARFLCSIYQHAYEYEARAERGSTEDFTSRPRY